MKILLASLELTGRLDTATQGKAMWRRTQRRVLGSWARADRTDKVSRGWVRCGTDPSFKASASSLSCQHCDLLSLAARTSGEWGLASFQPTKFVIRFYSCPPRNENKQLPTVLTLKAMLLYKVQPCPIPASSWTPSPPPSTLTA